MRKGLVVSFISNAFHQYIHFLKCLVTAEFIAGLSLLFIAVKAKVESKPRTRAFLNPDPDDCWVHKKCVTFPKSIKPAKIFPNRKHIHMYYQVLSILNYKFI